jgi:hypothetical protein
MRERIPERDWKLFTKLREVALERFCERTLDEMKQLIASSSASHYERYLAIFKVVDRQDTELARLFDDFRRSTAIVQLAAMRARKLITDEELATFTAETREAVKSMSFG